MQVIKRNGAHEPAKFDKIEERNARIREILGEENTSAGAKDESAEDQDQDLTKPLVVADPEVSNFEATVNKSSRE